MKRLKRKEWIDFIKFIAILGVINEHLFGIFGSSKILYSHISFSIPLFVLVGGYTSALTIDKFKLEISYFIKRSINLLILYALASLFHHLYQYHGLNLKVYIYQLTTFSASGTFYFIYFYMQLILLSSLIYKVIAKKALVNQIVRLFIIYLLSIFFTKIPIAPHLYGGGKYILGGTYFFVYSLGIFLYTRLPNKTNKKDFYILIISTILAFFYYEFKSFYNLNIQNPPLFYQIYYALLIFLILYIIGSLFKNMFQSCLMRVLLFIGQNTVYIYLFHVFVIENIIYMMDGRITIFRDKLILFTSAIVIPIAIAKFIKLIKYISLKMIKLLR